MVCRFSVVIFSAFEIELKTILEGLNASCLKILADTLENRGELGEQLTKDSNQDGRKLNGELEDTMNVLLLFNGHIFRWGNCKIIL